MRKLYKYEDMPDKSIKGIQKEVESGLAIMAAYFNTTHGVPLQEITNSLEEKSNEKKLLGYMQFRNEYPELFIK